MNVAMVRAALTKIHLCAAENHQAASGPSLWQLDASVNLLWP